MTVMENFLQLNVGGIPYCIAKCHIEKFPESYFACLIKKEWSAESDQAISIARDGDLFQFVNAFLVCGSLPRSVTGCPSLDPETIKRLKVEADFYCLTELVLQCQHYFRPTTEVNLPNYLLMQRFLEQLTGYVGGSYELPVEYCSDLAKALKPLSIPFCLVGELHQQDYEFNKSSIYNQSTCANPNIPELLAASSPPSLESDSGEDKRLMEIEASKLKREAVQAVGDRVCSADFVPGVRLTKRPRKLVIHREGCSQELSPVLPPNREEGHIGTLVVILNSEYTGGELEVTHGGRTEVVTGPYSWVAMYGDCLHKINPVTSGTRVSLIYDIYGTPRTENLWDNHQDSAIRRFWTEHYTTKLFPNGYSGEKFGFKGLADTEKEPILDCLNAELANGGSDGVIIALQKLYSNYQSVEPSALQSADRALYELLTNPSSIHIDKYDVQIVTVVICRCQTDDRNGDNYTRCMLLSAAAVERELKIVYDSESEDDDSEVIGGTDNTSCINCGDEGGAAVNDGGDQGDNSARESVSTVADSGNSSGDSVCAPCTCECATNSAEQRDDTNTSAIDDQGSEDEEEEEEEEKEEMPAKRQKITRPKVLIPYSLDIEGMLDYKRENLRECQPEQLVFVVTCLQVHKANM